MVYFSFNQYSYDTASYPSIYYRHPFGFAAILIDFPAPSATLCIAAIVPGLYHVGRATCAVRSVDATAVSFQPQCIVAIVLDLCHIARAIYVAKSVGVNGIGGSVEIVIDRYSRDPEPVPALIAEGGNYYPWLLCLLESPPKKFIWGLCQYRAPYVMRCIGRRKVQRKMSMEIFCLRAVAKKGPCIWNLSLHLPLFCKISFNRNPSKPRIFGLIFEHTIRLCLTHPSLIRRIHVCVPRNIIISFSYKERCTIIKVL